MTLRLLLINRPVPSPLSFFVSNVPDLSLTQWTKCNQPRSEGTSPVFSDGQWKEYHPSEDKGYPLRTSLFRHFMDLPSARFHSVFGSGSGREWKFRRIPSFSKLSNRWFKVTLSVIPDLPTFSKIYSGLVSKNFVQFLFLFIFRLLLFTLHWTLV